MRTADMLNCFMQYSDYGIIFLDEDGIISNINEKAKKTVGLSIDNAFPHPSGKIEKGDIVIIADTQMGSDDGELTPQDLVHINVKDKKLKAGDVFVGVGVYQTPGSNPKYKFTSRTSLTTELSLEEFYHDHHIRTAVDFKKNTIEIQVDDDLFHINFLIAYGHMVVIDHLTGHIKFYQEKGYSIRKESIRDLLNGQAFQAKGHLPKTGSAIGKKYTDLFGNAPYVDTISRILQGQSDGIENAIYEINGRPLLISLLPVLDEKGNPSGVVIKINEFSELQEKLWAHNQLIVAMETKHKEIFSSQKDIPKDTFTHFIGNSGEMREAKHLAYKVALRNCNVIIRGESGTGKSLLAKEIYKAGGSVGPFVSVDCSTISPSLFESEIFGYVGGAFTGADPKGKKGFFETASGGTIFLDELGEIPPSIQVKLLNVLQNKEIYRVGSTKPIPVSVRIIAATNKDLEEEIRKGNFRKDLYYRISVFSIELPPLRKCKDDLFFLAQEFLAKTCEEYGLEDKIFSSEALSKLLSYDWPGNIRELSNVIERAAIFCDDSIIYSEHINLPIKSGKMTLKEITKELEKSIIIETLRSLGNDKKQTMEELGLSKSAFYAKLKEYEIDL